jgi:hypothetical protein
MANTEYGVLGRIGHHPSHQAVYLHLPYGAGPAVCDADTPWPEELRTRVLPIRGAKRLRGSTRLGRLALLSPGAGHHWILRRRTAEAIAALGRPGDIRLVPAPLVDEDGFLVGDWVLLDVRARYPLDRMCASFSATWADRPHASLIARVDRVAWSPDRAPAAPIFRVAEAPELLVARADVAARFTAILGPWVVPQLPPYDAATHDGLPCAPLRGIGGLHRAPPGDGPGLSIDEATGRAAFAALYRLLAGDGRSGDRDCACASPITAYFLARLVDAAPADDTRAAALTHPRYATLYARDVDRGPRDDTRRAAITDRASAFAYLDTVERAAHPDLVAALGADTVASRMDEQASLRANQTPLPERFPPSWEGTVAAPPAR